jgi:DNA polymerase III alpha subunit
MSKFPISCEYDHLAFVPEEFGGTEKEAPPGRETKRVKRPRRPYAELRAASAFSFLDGASLPEDLIYWAAQKDVPAMALVDTNGVYGAPRFYGAAKKAGIKALVGAELVLETGNRQPATVLVENREGYKKSLQADHRRRRESRERKSAIHMGADRAIRRRSSLPDPR